MSLQMGPIHRWPSILLGAHVHTHTDARWPHAHGSLQGMNSFVTARGDSPEPGNSWHPVNWPVSRGPRARLGRQVRPARVADMTSQDTDHTVSLLGLLLALLLKFCYIIF